MSCFRSGDPLDDFDRLDREQAAYEARLPICDDCKRRIYDDDYYEDDGDNLCEDCLKARHRKSTDDYAQAYL